MTYPFQRQSRERPAKEKKNIWFRTVFVHEVENDVQQDGEECRFKRQMQNKEKKMRHVYVYQITYMAPTYRTSRLASR